MTRVLHLAGGEYPATRSLCNVPCNLLELLDAEAYVLWLYSREEKARIICPECKKHPSIGMLLLRHADEAYTNYATYYGTYTRGLAEDDKLLRKRIKAIHLYETLLIEVYHTQRKL